MIYEVSKEKLHNIEEYIKEESYNKMVILRRIQSGKFKTTDVFKVNSMEFYICGMLLMLSVLRLKYTIKRYEFPVDMSIKNFNREVDFDEVTVRCKDTLEKLRTLQLEESENMKHNSILDMDFEKDIRANIYLNMIYGMKVVANLLGLSLNAKVGADEVLSVVKSTVKNENLEVTRRKVGRIMEVAEKRIETFDKMLILNTRKRVWEIRRDRINAISEINKDNESVNLEEKQYINSKINSLDKEMIQLREILRETKAEIDERRKEDFKIYLGVEEK